MSNAQRPIFDAERFSDLDVERFLLLSIDVRALPPQITAFFSARSSTG
jgi:hypothetical protein